MTDWAAAYERYHDDLYKYACSRGFAPDDAADIVQTVFVDALRKSYDERGELRAWLYCLMRCRMVDFLRYHGRRRTVALAADWDSPDAGIEDGIVDTLAAASALARDVTRLQALALWQFYVDDCSIEDVCKRLQLGQPAVKALLHRGRARLSRNPHWNSAPI